MATQHASLSQSTFTPNRLIHVSGEGSDLQLRLIDVEAGQHLEYSTLSYCWGAEQKSQTIRTNIVGYKSSIDMASLPQTLKDAVYVTWKLRIFHIWIDSLCIIQDDPEDKTIQIAQMPKIFASSKLTISTSRALFAGEGFLHDRMPTNQPDFVFKLPYRLPSNGDLGNIILTSPAPELSDSLLLSRAWAYQEHLMSPRILDWSGKQLTWTCPDAAQSQGYLDGGSVDGGLRVEHSLRSAFLDMSLPKPKQRFQWRNIEAIKFWHNAVLGYTEKELTIQSDRALAIAGIAELCGNACGQKYLAGHWMLDWFKEYFVASLMWSMKDRPARLLRPTTLQGPSWSWTAVNGPIHFWDVEDLLAGRCRERIKAEVIDCSVEFENPQAPYGAVASGTLVLEARARPATWLRSRPVQECLRGQNPDALVAADGGFIPARMVPDAHETEFDDPEVISMDVVLLEVGYGASTDEETAGAKGLVLKDLGDGFYSRLGIFSVDSREIQSRCKQLWKAKLNQHHNSELSEPTKRKSGPTNGDASPEETPTAREVTEEDDEEDKHRLSSSDPNYWTKLREKSDREYEAVQKVWLQHYDVFKDCDRQVLVLM